MQVHRLPVMVMNTSTLTMPSIDSNQEIDHSAGCIVLTMADDEAARRAEAALCEQGVEQTAVIHYTAADRRHSLRELLEGDDQTDEVHAAVERTASELAGSTSEWLIVAAPDDETRRRILGVARSLGAGIALSYEQLAFDKLRGERRAA